MADDPQKKDDLQGQVPKTADDKPAGDTGSDGGTFSAEYVKELRKEAADWRTKLRVAEKESATLTTQQKTADDQKLAADQKWQELAESRAGELEKLQAQVKTQEIQQLKMATIQELGLPSDALEFLTGDNAEAIKAQGEKFKALMPETPPAGSQSNPRQATTAIPGGTPPEETRDQKNSRLGLAGGRTNSIS